MLGRNLDLLDDFRDTLQQLDLLSHGSYVRCTKVALKSATSNKTNDTIADMLVTSPPYGDNTTTVPYGQHSYLPLQWIDFADIANGISDNYLSTTHEIDRLSLGGSRRDAVKAAACVIDRSATFKATLASLKDEPIDRLTRVAAFVRDLDACIDPLLSRLRENAYMIWVVGNRRIAGREIRTDQILTELLASRSATLVCAINRIIPTKRMALKNSITETPRKENILVFRKA